MVGEALLVGGEVMRGFVRRGMEPEIAQVTCASYSNSNSGQIANPAPANLDDRGQG